MKKPSPTKKPPAPAKKRKVVPMAGGAERRRKKIAREKLHELADAVEGLGDDPDAASNLTLVGNMAMLEGSFEDAIDAFSRALSLEPDQVSALAGRGRALAAAGEQALPLADFDRAAALAPGKP